MTAYQPILDLPSFSKVDASTLVEELRALLDECRAEIARVIDSGRSSWDDIVQPMDELANRLNQFWAPVSHLNAVRNSESLREAYNAAVELLSEYYTELGQNKGLYQAYQALEDSAEFEKLPQAKRKALEDALRSFRLSGVSLEADAQKRYGDISRRLAQLTSKFSDNVLDATQAWKKPVNDKAVLAGLPDSALDMLRSAASKADDCEAEYLLSLEFPCYHAIMTYCDTRELREEMYIAFSTRASDQGPHAGQFDNTETMHEILGLRQEMARLLGFDTYAEYSLATKMAEDPRAVTSFLEELAEKGRPFARREFDELQAFARESDGERITQAQGLQAWDVGYYSEKLRKSRYDLSQEALRPYFPAERVIKGMFSVVSKLFGVQFEQAEAGDCYHEDVTFYQVKRDGEVIAAVYMDLFARQQKRGGAWMADYAVRYERHDQDGVRLQLPVAFMTSNFTPATDNQPSLLTHDEVTTLFHEFGHALHHMLTQIDCYDVSGINGVAWDAVELPSQFMENWCWEPEALELISGHYETGEPLPVDLLDKMLAAKHFNSGMMMVRQIEFSLFDFRLHQEYETGFDVQKLLDEVRSKVAVVKVPDYNRFQHSFSHVFAGGYAAGYYSYKWAEVLAADAFDLFSEKGIFDAETGQRFLENILSKGGSEEALILFKRFRGREPSVEALLKQSGLQ
ncbi:M3 family metallopeptidase [Allohahella marinimesophila]|uniref:oligopeptidase A n=1 Tax=Allohahella marinimesophila TaxID=1054972 RepID=A0ABP7PDN5_9GAMM